MLQSLNDAIRNSKWLGWAIIGLISVPFALWGIGSYLGIGKEAVVATVNGVEISARDYERAYYQQRTALTRQFGGRLPPALADSGFLKNQAIEGLITQQVIRQTVADGGYRVADATLRDQIFASPRFQVNGKFNKDAYDRELLSLGMSPLEYEDTLRQAILLDQMRKGVEATAFYSSRELAEIERLRGQRRSAAVLTFKVADFTSNEALSDADIEKYYNEHQAQLVNPEAVKVQYLELDAKQLATQMEVSEQALHAHYDEQPQRFTIPEKRFARHILIKVPGDASEEVVAEKRAQIEKLRERVLGGESFAALAREVSEDPGSAKDGGDLGQVERGTMVKPFEEALFALPDGGLSEPVRTVFGFHLIKLERLEPERVQTFEEVRPQLLRELQQREAENMFYDRVDVLANEAYENSSTLSSAAEATGLSIKTSDWIERTTGSGVGEHAAVRNAAFSPAVLDQGLNSDLIELDTNHVLVLRVAEHREQAPRALAEVREQVVAAVRSERARAAAGEAAGHALSALREHIAPAEAARTTGAALATFDALERNAAQLDPGLREALFAMPRPAGDLPTFKQLSNATGDPVVLVLQKVEEPPAAEAPADQETANATLGRDEFGAWLQALRDGAKIERRDDLL